MTPAQRSHLDRLEYLYARKKPKPRDPIPSLAFATLIAAAIGGCALWLAIVTEWQPGRQMEVVAHYKAQKHEAMEAK